MTNQECIETLKLALAEVEWNYPMNYSIAIEQAIETVKYKAQHEISESVNRSLEDSVRFELENSRAWFEKSKELTQKLTAKENQIQSFVKRIKNMEHWGWIDYGYEAVKKDEVLRIMEEELGEKDEVD